MYSVCILIEEQKTGRLQFPYDAYSEQKWDWLFCDQSNAAIRTFQVNHGYIPNILSRANEVGAPTNHLGSGQ